MGLLTGPATNEHEQSTLRNNWLRFLKAEQKKTRHLKLLGEQLDSCWIYVNSFLIEFGRERLISLSADYESLGRLKEVLGDTKKRLGELLDVGSDMVQALSLLTDDHAVRIMTIHKSKSLEFDSVIILGVEEQTFWGKKDAERCAFFVAVSRAKKRLVLTHSELRQRPSGNLQRWHEVRDLHNEFIGYAEPFVKGFKS